MNNDLDRTMRFQRENDNLNTVSGILTRVYDALKERGYDPTSQMVGYIMSGDPTYITSHKDARYLIRRLERDEIVEELVRLYYRYLDGDLQEKR